MMIVEKSAKIYVAGHRGMVGSAIVRELKRQGYDNIVTRTHAELDLTRQADVEKFFAEEKPEYVFLIAAKVGGMVANRDYPADSVYHNTMIEMNVIHEAWVHGCKKLLFIGSVYIYPKSSPQPIKEDAYLSAAPASKTEAFALAKVIGITYCQSLNKQYGMNFISIMPPSIYGPNDNYHPINGHVLPAMIRRFHEAKLNNLPSVTCWGDGTPMREFLYVDDMANFCVFAMDNYNSSEIINIGTGKEITIKDFANLVAEIVGYKGEILWDTSMPNGAPRQVLDVSKAMALGWNYKTELRDGIKLAYEDFLNTPPPEPVIKS